MPSIKDLKKRIGTVKNTQQTTRAMKMVSAAKLRRAQDAIQSQRPFSQRISALIRELSEVTDSKKVSPLVARNEEEAPRERKKILLVVVTSDRGLCGGFNSNIIKICQKSIQTLSASGADVELAFVGKRGYDFFKTKSTPVAGYYSELGGKVSFAKAKKLADLLIDRYLKGEVDEVKFVFNEFQNAVTQRAVVENFLPLESLKKEEQASATGSALPPLYIIKPSPEEVMKELLAKNFSIQAFRILLESQAGEHGARMSAMENATKNAGEMIRKLTLQFNKQRQAGITKELLEIISGSESQKG
jgi:F-type H+-transporting ATPase subunit gamma